LVHTIKRKILDKMKEHFLMKDETDIEFLRWWRRNFGTGYEKEIEIEDKRGNIKRLEL
jgi:hypothetical protein